MCLPIVLKTSGRVCHLAAKKRGHKFVLQYLSGEEELAMYEVARWILTGILTREDVEEIVERILTDRQLQQSSLPFCLSSRLDF